MEAVGIVLIVLLVAAVVGVAAYFSHQARKARRDAMAQLARELNMSFDPSYRRDFDGYYRHFELFRRGHTKRAYNTLAGTFDITGRAFRGFMGDYTYSITTSNGKGSQTTTYNVSYIILHAPYGEMPSLLIRPETTMDKLKGALGFDDIDFESEEFSRQFFVKSSDKKFAYDVIHPRMMEFLMSRRGPALDITHGAICVVDGTRRWHPIEYKDKLADLQQFFELWPEHLLCQLDATDRPPPTPPMPG